MLLNITQYLFNYSILLVIVCKELQTDDQLAVKEAVEPEADLRECTLHLPRLTIALKPRADIT